MKNKIRTVGVGVLVALWAALALYAWFGPKQAISESERRPLEQMPQVSLQSILSGSFTADVEDASVDQFPLRDAFRRVKSVFTYYVLGQKDNNGIYLADGYAAKMEYPLNTSSVKHALEKFQYLYDTYLQDSKIVMAVVPDKGYYLAGENGYLAMDYEQLFAQMQQGMPWADHVDLTQSLSIADYYRTDTHWRQENLLPVAQTLAQALGAELREDFRQTQLQTPFYGVYYGQAALPMEPDQITLMESDWLADCRVFNHETGKYGSVYDLQKLAGMDPYDVYLSGAQALLTIENPHAATDRELIVFRDSFGSSLVPLLAGSYAKVTLVDLRYIPSNMLGDFLDFHGQDVLMLYSTLILNSSKSMK